VATITKEKSIITTKREGSQTLPHQKKKSRLKNPKRLTWPPMISCTIATRMSTYTCLKLIQTHLIFPKTLILHPLSLSVAQPSKEAPTFLPVLLDVPLVPYVHVPPPSLNPQFSKKCPQAALNEDFPPEHAPYPDKY